MANPMKKHRGARDATTALLALFELAWGTAAATTAAGAKDRPVIVRIYDGAFVGGSSALYPLTYMALAGDVVVVLFNYRLGVLGFMANPAFDPSSNRNYAFEDQREVLRWVKQNISTFGGDPGNVGNLSLLIQQDQTANAAPSPPLAPRTREKRARATAYGVVPVTTIEIAPFPVAAFPAEVKVPSLLRV